ncbi:MAG: potassium channel family protein [Polyangia bacterium]
MPNEPGFKLRERILVATLALGAVFLLGTFGFWSLGEAYLPRNPWSLADCAFFTVTTITTVGFAELPHLARVPGARVFTVAVLLVGLGVALYCVSAFTTYFIEGEFSKGRMRKRMARTLEALTDHIIVCGVGTTGIHVVEELISTGWPVVAIDVDERHLERAQTLSAGLLPTLQGDATEDAVLERAGIRRARGLVAALTDDKMNLFIVVTARELNPRLKIVAKGVDVKAADKLRHAGADCVVNPAFIGGSRMVSEMIRPQVVEFLDLMLRDKEKNLRIEEVTVPSGSPLSGKPLADAQIRQYTNLLVVALRERPRGDEPGRFLYNPGPETEISEGMALIVLGETDGVHRLRAAMARGFDAT